MLFSRETHVLCVNEAVEEEYHWSDDGRKTSQAMLLFRSRAQCVTASPILKFMTTEGFHWAGEMTCQRGAIHAVHHPFHSSSIESEPLRTGPISIQERGEERRQCVSTSTQCTPSHFLLPPSIKSNDILYLLLFLLFPNIARSRIVFSSPHPLFILVHPNV